MTSEHYFNIKHGSIILVSDDLLNNTYKWLEKSGRALELRVARSLRKHGKAETTLGAHYEDVKTGVVREGDVLANFKWTGMNAVQCSISLTVECKGSSKHPWVAFYTDAPSINDRNLENWLIFAHGPFNGITQSMESAWPGNPPFTYDKVASHVVAAHTDDSHNPAQDAVRQALSYAAAVQADYIQNQVTRRVGLACIAAVVTSAQLMSCRLDASGNPHLELVNDFTVWGYGSGGKRNRVYVLSESALPDFAKHLEERAGEAEERAKYQ